MNSLITLEGSDIISITREELVNYTVDTEPSATSSVGLLLMKSKTGQTPVMTVTLEWTGFAANRCYLRSSQRD
jgi:hypothetical protein